MMLMAIVRQGDRPVRDKGVSRIIVVTEMPPRVDHHIDLQNVGALEAMRDAIMTLFVGGDEMIRAFGVVGESDKVFEIVIPDTDLRSAMLIYARNVALLSLLISLITAGLVFWAINRIMIRPVREMTRSMLDFAEAPVRCQPHHPARSARRRAGGWPNGSWRPCSRACTRRSASRSTWPISALPCPRSTTTCATYSLRRN